MPIIMHQTRNKFTGMIAAAMFLAPIISIADEPARRYRTLKERREAGLTHEITDWLQISPLIELEYVSQTFFPEDPNLSSSTHKTNSKTLQLDTRITFAEWFNAEIVYEYDDQLDEFVLDEAIAEFELDDFKLEFGKLYVPFGEYYSRLVTGPLLEFGETRARALVLSYEPSDRLEASAFVFKSKIDKTITTNNKLDWGFSINFSPVETISAGFGYISDLSESDEKLLDENAFYQQRVNAVTTYANFRCDDFETSIEWLQALDSFSELDADRNRPRAWNLELAFYPDNNFEWAFRIEGSKELEDAPEFQAGIAATLHVNRNISATLEFLRGRFKRGLAEYAQNSELADQNLLVGQLVISF